MATTTEKKPPKELTIEDMVTIHTMNGTDKDIYFREELQDNNLDVFIDKSETNKKIYFDVKTNGVAIPYTKVVVQIVSGNLNDKGEDPFEVEASLRSAGNFFTIDPSSDDLDHYFSDFNGKYSVANYIMYGTYEIAEDAAGIPGDNQGAPAVNGPVKEIMSIGKIFRTDILNNFAEGIPIKKGE